MQRHRAEWWANRIDGDAEEIAQPHDVKMRTLIWWQRRETHAAEQLFVPSANADIQRTRQEFHSEVEGVTTDDSNEAPESMDRIVPLPAPTSLVIAFAQFPQAFGASECLTASGHGDGAPPRSTR
jgi:hypothetical protein